MLPNINQESLTRFASDHVLCAERYHGRDCPVVVEDLEWQLGFAMRKYKRRLKYAVQRPQLTGAAARNNQGEENKETAEKWVHR